MSYKIKEGLQSIPLGSEEGTVYFDAETQNTYVLDDVAADIIECFKKIRTYDEALNMLCALYHEDAAAIEPSFKGFIEQLIGQGLLLSAEDTCK